MAGYTVLKEKTIPKQLDLRHADNLLWGYGFRPLANDFTVLTPIWPSAANADLAL